MHQITTKASAKASRIQHTNNEEMEISMKLINERGTDINMCSVKSEE